MTSAAPLTGHPTQRRRSRPFPVTILAFIQVVLGVLNLGVAIALAANPELMAQLGILVDRSAFAVVEGTSLILIFLLVGSLELTSAALLLRLRQGGWTLAMLLAGTNLAVQIVQYVADGTLTTVSLLLNVVSVLYLNQSTVREAFGLVPPGHSTLEDERG